MPILLCSLCSSAFPARGTRPVVGCRPGRDARHSPVSVPDRWNSSRPTPIRTCATPSIWKRSLGSTSRSPKPSRGRGPASREECHGPPAVLSISSSRRRLLLVSERRRTAASKQRPILPPRCGADAGHTLVDRIRSRSSGRTREGACVRPPRPWRRRAGLRAPHVAHGHLARRRGSCGLDRCPRDAIRIRPAPRRVCFFKINPLISSAVAIPVCPPIAWGAVECYTRPPRPRRWPQWLGACTDGSEWQR